MILIFDLYDTILKDISFDFDNGLRFTYEFFRDKCSYEEFKAYAQTFLPLYEERKKTNREVSFIKDEFPMFCDRFHEYPQIDRNLLDYQIMNEIQKETLLDEVRETLEILHKRGHRMYVLSNSIFLASSNKRLLRDFSIENYFVDVFSSADFGKRKPDKSFFEYAVGKILNDNPENSRADIYYIGNDYCTDVSGAVSVGLQTIWYNADNFPDTNHYDVFNIKEFSEITEIIPD